MEKTYCFGFKRLDGLHVRADVVCDGFKLAQDLLRFIHNAFILQDGAVVRHVYCRRLGI